MEIAINLLIGCIAAIHFYIVWFEMFAWETKGKKIFRSIPSELFPKTKILAANQGLYNGFLASGLLWTFLIEDPLWSSYIGIFFLACIVMAGVYGAVTVEKKIFYIQALPALFTIVLILLNF